MLRRSTKAAEDSFHSHSNDGSSRHTHSTNPAHTSSRNSIADKLRSDTAITKAHERLYGTEEVSHKDPSLRSILQGKRRNANELTNLRNTI